MASASHTSPATVATLATASDQNSPMLPLENEMNEEAQSTQTETISCHEETSALVKEKLPSDSTPYATKDKQIDQPPAGDTTISTMASQIQSPDVAEPQADNTVEIQPEEQELTEKGQDEHESTTKEPDEHVENKAAQLESEEAAPVKYSMDVPEKHIQEVEASVKDAEEKHSMETVSIEVQELLPIEFAENGHPKTVGVSQLTTEPTGNQTEPTEVHPAKDEAVETSEDEIKDTEAVPREVKSKTKADMPEVVAGIDVQLEASEQIETAPAEVYKSMPEVEIQPKEHPETTGKADSSQGSEVEPVIKPEDTTVKKQDFVICFDDEKSSDDKNSSYSETETPVKVVLSNQDAVSELKKETGEASSPSEVIEKVSAEEKEKHVVDKPPTDFVLEAEDDKENVSEDKEVVTKEKPEESETIKKNTETAADGKCTETAQEIDTEHKEKEHPTEKSAELDKEKVAAEVTKEEPMGDENIEKITEPAADDKFAETVREIDTESKDKENAANNLGELHKEKVAKATETASEVIETGISTKESSNQKQLAVTTKEAFKPKHSNGIISKVKQSLVKAKKAITRKSPGSKTLSTDAKGEIKV